MTGGKWPGFVREVWAEAGLKTRLSVLCACYLYATLGLLAALAAGPPLSVAALPAAGIVLGGIVYHVGTRPMLSQFVVAAAPLACLVVGLGAIAR